MSETQDRMPVDFRRQLGQDSQAKESASTLLDANPLEDWPSSMLPALASNKHTRRAGPVHCRAS